MKDLLRRYHKYLVGFGLIILFMMIGSLCSIVRYNLPETVRTIVYQTLGADISTDSIKFPERGKIYLEGVVLKDNGETIVESPVVEIYYDFPEILKGRIKEIKLMNPEAWITRSEDGINVLNAFMKEDVEVADKQSNTEVSPSGEYINEGSKIPIDRISVVEGYLYYRDLSYIEPIEKELESVDGYVSFDIVDNIELSFEGTNEKETIGITFDNKEESYNVAIELNEVRIDNKLMQFAYVYEKLEYKDGIVDLDLKISPKGLYGHSTFREFSASYEDLDKDITFGSGKIGFYGERIEINGDYLLEEQPGSIFLEYTFGKGAEIEFNLKDVNYSTLESYSILRDLNFPIEDATLEEANVNLKFFTGETSKVDVSFKVPSYNYDLLKLDDISGRFYYEGDDFYLKDIKFDLDYGNDYIPIKIGIEAEAVLDTEKAVINYKILNESKNTNMSNMMGKASIGYDEKILNGELYSDILDLNLIWDIVGKKLEVKQTSSENLEVNIGDKKVTNKSNLNFKVDLETKEFVNGNGNIDITYDNKNIEGNIRTEKSRLYLDEIRLSDLKSSLDGSGWLDFVSKEYDFNIDSKNLSVGEYLNLEGLDLIGNIKGNIKGNDKGIEGDLEISEVNGNYYVDFEELEGDLIFNTENNLEAYFNGYLGKLEYKGISFSLSTKFKCR